MQLRPHSDRQSPSAGEGEAPERKTEGLPSVKRGGRGLRGLAALGTAVILIAPTETKATYHAHEFAEIPPSVKVLLFSTYEDPNVVTYDPAKLSAQGLLSFAADLCGHDHAQYDLVKPRVWQRIQGRERAHIFCWKGLKE